MLPRSSRQNPCVSLPLLPLWASRGSLCCCKIHLARPMWEENVGLELDYTTGTPSFQLLQYQQRAFKQHAQLRRTLSGSKQPILLVPVCLLPWYYRMMGPDMVYRTTSNWWDDYMKRVAGAFGNCTWNQQTGRFDQHSRDGCSK